MTPYSIVRVFTHAGQGGNPCPIVFDASGMTEGEMQAVAQATGHECGFALPPPSDDYDHHFRYWVPNHEMEMCGHATIGLLWFLVRQGLVRGSEVRIATAGGPVTGFVEMNASGMPQVEITQPAGKITNLTPQEEADVLSTLKISRADLLDLPLQNAVTSRVKTLIPMRDTERLHALVTDMAKTEACCRRISSTGLYPYAPVDGKERTFEARQFPRSSGYPEDAATGIAASALAFGLLREKLIQPNDSVIRILQGRAMGNLSEIRVRLGFVEGRAISCLLGGDVAMADQVAEGGH